MKAVIFLWFLFLIHSCINEPLRCKNCAQRKSGLSGEGLRLLRFEYIKKQILKKLHLSEAPKTNLPKPPLKSLLLIAEMAENETSIESDDQTKTESIVIYPKNENLDCSENETQPCFRFEFVIPANLSPENFVSAEVWFYTHQTKDIRVHQITTDHMQNATSKTELKDKVIQSNAKSWIKYNVRSDKFRSNVKTESKLVLEAVDYSDDANFDNTIGRTGADRPFLVIRNEEVKELPRVKRGTSCSESNSSCCKENFFLNFSEIGWDNWILIPDGYQANFCRGRCFNDLSSMRFYHSAVLLNFIRENKYIAEEIGLSMCCTPSTMGPVSIIYRNEEGLLFHKNIENMKVESCDCA